MLLTNIITDDYNWIVFGMGIPFVMVHHRLTAAVLMALRSKRHERRIGNLREKGAWHRGPGAFFVVTTPT
mgnify:CR=1 FL=1